MGKNKDYYRQLSNDKILRLNEGATLKLMKYIQDFLKEGRLQDAAISFDYIGLNERDTYIVFNTWFSMDYITPYGKSFVRHFLEERRHEISKYEKQILEERERSYISLYEVINIRGDNVTVFDLICKRVEILYQPENIDMFEVGSVFLGRISDLLGRKKFIAVFHQIDIKIKNLLLNSILNDYYSCKSEEPMLKIREYLKKYSNRVYYILSQMYGFKKDKQIKRIEKQIKEFENYLRDEKGLSEKTIEVHIRNLREFYRFYLGDTNITLVDINADMVEEFIMDGIIDMFFHSKSDLSSNITTLRKFVSYLKEKKYIDAENYNKITDILKNKDYYIEKFVRYKDVIERKISFEDWFDDNYQDEIVSIEFEIDKKLKNIIDKYIPDENNSFITDFDTYIDYIAKNKVKVTKLNKYIQRKHLLKLNDMMINSIEVKKTVNQIDIPILHLFYKFGVDNFILTIDDKDNISVSSNLSKYDELSINEKIAVFIDYIWNKMDWNEIGLQDMYGVKEEYQNRKEFAKILARLETCRYYDYENVTILHRLEGSEANIFGFLVPTAIPGCMHVAQVFNSRILKYFSYLGLLEISFKEDANVSYKKYGYDIDKIKVSKFGKEIFKYLGGTDNLIEETKNMKGKLINLFSRKKIKK